MRTFDAMIKISLPDRFDGTRLDVEQALRAALDHGLPVCEPPGAPIDLDGVEVAETTGEILVPTISLVHELAIQREKIASLESAARLRAHVAASSKKGGC